MDPETIFKKEENLLGWISFFFTKDQNSNSLYLQGSKTYLAKEKTILSKNLLLILFYFNKICFIAFF